MSDLKHIVKLLRANTDTRRLYDVFTNFVEMAAISFRSAVDLRGRAKLEEEYKRIAERYTSEQMARFSECLALLTAEMEAEPRDILGQVYMELEISDASMGQFYTPYDIAKLIAEMACGDLSEQLKERDFVSVHEPACGAGAFLIAITQKLRREGVNYQQRLFVAAEDLSAVAVHMTYVHLTLLHVPAVVHHRNSLTGETFDTWHTPALVIGGWAHKLRKADATTAARQLLTASPAPAEREMTVSLWDDVFAEVG